LAVTSRRNRNVAEVHENQGEFEVLDDVPQVTVDQLEARRHVGLRSDIPLVLEWYASRTELTASSKLT